ncbi:hypothetical protein GF407_09550 [candidate division KSB1 bacterium]|nr:hypothetical protein [candidate division KSB1 bacterium]
MIEGIENFIRAIEFSGPAYIPAVLEVDLDWLIDKDEGKRRYCLDLKSQFRTDLLDDLDVAVYYLDLNKDQQLRRWRDEWNTGWEDDGHGARPVRYPLSDGYEALRGFSFPDQASTERFRPAEIALQERCGRYARASIWFTLFERLWMLRGFSNMLMDPYLHQSDFFDLRDRLVEHNLGVIDQWLARGVNAVFFSDDWGTQRGLLIQPDDWRKYYRDAYKRLFDRVHAGGAHVWMHLCGNIMSILPDLIDIGLDVLNPVQPQAMDIKELGKHFSGKLCFNGGVDVQGTMISSTPDEVKTEVDELIETFGAHNGGYIGGTSHSIMPETPLDNVIALYEAFLQYQNI